MRLRFTFYFLLASMPLLAQEPLQISGELRQRSEYRQNADFDSRLGDEQIFVLQRLRLGLHWNFPNQLAAFVQMQDSRLWGEEGSTTQPLDNTDVHQAYFEMQRLAGKPLRVRLGRQEMKFGSQRLVGVNDWNNVGRAFDALRLTYGEHATTLDLWLAQIRDKNAATIDGNQEFAGAFFSSGSAATRVFDAYAAWLIDDRDFPIGSSSGEALFLGTCGVRLAGVLRQRLEYEAEGVYQTGKHGNLDVNAFGVILQGKIKLGQKWLPKIGASYKFGSGDENPNDGKLQTLSTLFPTVHGQFGAADYAGWSNIADVMFLTEISPAPALRATARLHYLRLAHGNDAWYLARGFTFDKRAETLLPARPGESIELGYNFDLQVDYDFREQVGLSLGVSRFFAGDFIKAGNPEADDSNWGYFSIKIRW